ncbi:MAG: glycosyltransferase [Enterococcus cecorum]|nr:glycosyltransferase [Enterococcus cecorum]CAI3478898.1 glycosyltransferase [Enterococcus cecorum]
MENTPQISIIVPVYNAERYLKYCIDSILRQTFTNYELILVNDGSTDYSLKICHEYASKDERIKILSKENGGPSSTRNLGLSHAKGKYIAFIDADDYVLDNYLEKLWQLSEDRQADITVVEYYRKDERDGLLYYHLTADEIGQIEEVSSDEAIKRMIIGINFMPVWGKLYRLELFNNLSFDENRLYEENFIQTKLYSLANKIIYLKENLYCYRTVDTGIMKTPLTLKKIRDDIEGCEEILVDIVVANKYHDAVKEEWMKCYLTRLNIHREYLEVRQLTDNKIYKKIIHRLEMLKSQMYGK